MALQRTPASSWMQRTGLPSRLFETDRNDFELYEEDDEFVLSVELPGFDPEDITATWDDGVLNVAAEREDESREHRRTYHRRFRFPKTVADDEIVARYDNGILEISLPVRMEMPAQGEEIEVTT